MVALILRKVEMSMSNKPRKWWIAGLMSLFEPGLGQIYNGQFRKGVVFLALPIFVIPTAAMSFNATKVIFGLCAFVLFGAAFYVIAVTDAIWTARSLSTDYQRKPYNRIIAYIGIVLLVSLANQTMASMVKDKYIKTYSIPAGSMQPTLLVGDHIFVDMRQSARNPKHGDIIVFEYPVDPNKDFVKRVVAVGGDVVEIRDKELWVNNRPMKEMHTIHTDPGVLPKKASPRDNYGPATVPANSYFVMGDNRDESYDSRFWGFVEKARIKGAVRSIYWSWDSNNRTVRWSRIGAETVD